MAELVRVKEMARLKGGKLVCVEHEGVPYVVVNTKEDIEAYISLCSHKNLAIFPPQLKKGCLICPHHSVSFDSRTGKVKDDHGKDVPSNLHKVKTTIVEGVIYLSAMKKYRKSVPKKERKRVMKIAKKADRD